jgi:hypothetical protein
MSHFAKVENGLVTQVVVAEQEFIDTGALGHGWVQTSYNTIGGVHTQGGTPLRGNYAGVGFTYDVTNDVFYAPQPFDNWIMNSSWLWVPPIAMPVDEYFYTWNQETTAWVQGDLRPIPEPIPEPVVVVPDVVEPVVEAVVETPAEPVAATEPVVEPEVVVETPVESTPETPAA